MRLLILCFLFFSITLYGNCQTQFPHTVAEVEQFTHSALSEINASLEDLQHRPKEEVLAQWNKLGQKVFISACILHSLPALFKDPLLAKAGVTALQKLQLHLFQSIKTQETLSSLINSLETSEKRSAFTFLSGTPITTAPKKRLTVLSWNVCFLPPPISLIFGGMVSWKERKERLVDFLKKNDPDIICLQEVFDLEAAEFIYKSLKDSYLEFYTNIGPKNFGLHPHSIGLNSGLFIASKYPLKNLHFEKFTNNIRPVIERGFFSYTVMHGNQCYRIINTHLEASLLAAMPAPVEEECRNNQLAQILEWIDREPQRVTMLVGDLNICQGSKEKAELLLQSAFHNLCNTKAISHCDYTGYFWPEYFLNENRRFFQPKLSLLDYALMRPTFYNYDHIGAKIIQVHNPQAPADALSDHHCLFITIGQ